jgi:hypothetical protein
MYIKYSILFLIAIFNAYLVQCQLYDRVNYVYNNKKSDKEKNELMDLLRTNGFLQVLQQMQASQYPPMKQYPNILSPRIPMVSSPYAYQSSKQQQLASSIPEDNCGMPKITSYVAGGRDASDKDYPWHGQLLIFSSGSETFCGGTLISPYHIITAAHCYDEMKDEVLASSTRVVFRGIGVHYEAKAYKVIRHKEYIPAMTDFEAKMKGVKPGPTNDLAIIVIQTVPDHIRKRFIPVCLPNKDAQIDEGTVCKVMGHGFTSPKDESTFTMPTKMQVADVRISSNEDCKADVESKSIKDKISDSTICVRGPIQPCVGDSGGPLICTGSSSDVIDGAQQDNPSDEFVLSSYYRPRRFYLVGVTSFAVSTDEDDKCGEFKSAVFGLTTKHYDWIREIITDKSNLPIAASNQYYRSGVFGNF